MGISEILQTTFSTQRILIPISKDFETMYASFQREKLFYKKKA